MNERKRLTVYEVAQRFERTIGTIYRWLQLGWMPKPTRLGGRVFWYADNLDQWENDGFPRLNEKERNECLQQRSS